jgi:hypothetical protein
MATMTPFAGCQAVSFDDDWRAFLTDVGTGRLGIGEDFIFRRRDAIFLHESLGECLGPLDLRCQLGRAKRLDANGIQGIDHAIGQWHFRADDGQVDFLCFGKVDDGCIVGDGDATDALSDSGHARIARDGIEFRGFRGLGQFPGQGVFTAAGADY